jgi:outer membrane protein assembly factor BamB
MKHRIVWLAAFVLVSVAAIHAEDWLEFRGKGRVGVWTESGIVERFPSSGLKIAWRTPIKGGYSGASVANGRVFITDFEMIKRPIAHERAIALDEKTGRVLWMHEWDANYKGLLNNMGPGATPTVDGDRVYVQGDNGNLFCLDVKTGAVIWQKDFLKQYGIEPAPWGTPGAPLIDGNRLIVVIGANTISSWEAIGGEPGSSGRSGKMAPTGKVMAFDKMTGEEIWRALPTNTEAGYSQPVIFNVGSTRQLIIWHAAGVASLDPATGKVFWEEPFNSFHGASVATPVVSGLHLLITQYWNGAMMFDLSPKAPTAKVAWKGKEDSEVLNDTLHSLISTPVIDGDCIYGICSFGQLRCLDLKTGERLWETQAVTMEKRRHTTAFLVKNGNRYFINNDRGELIIARLSRAGYQEISRTALIKPTSDNAGTRRELGVVNWSHPAYANKHIFQRNDEEIISASLDAKDYPAAEKLALKN